jgi:hypothetical protein
MSFKPCPYGPNCRFLAQGNCYNYHDFYRYDKDIIAEEFKKYLEFTDVTQRNFGYCPANNRCAFYACGCKLIHPNPCLVDGNCQDGACPASHRFSHVNMRIDPTTMQPAMPMPGQQQRLPQQAALAPAPPLAPRRQQPNQNNNRNNNHAVADCHFDDRCNRAGICQGFHPQLYQQLTTKQPSQNICNHDLRCRNPLACPGNHPQLVQRLNNLLTARNLPPAIPANNNQNPPVNNNNIIN